MNREARPEPNVVRCAIYTRKSSEDGLEQAFNSLDAQHEACSAYIASQAGERWRLIKTRYDDGGVSGGTLDRPGIAQLMKNVDAGRVDMIVVYKIDRLTRSLADFSKLIERLDKAGCSFVSVTQAFNTSTSMGRLTLNVLLSFAQFEREVTSERIRDKIAASKKKGMWMGGMVPIGYELHPDGKAGGLVVCEKEAPSVQRIFDLYDQNEDLTQTARIANAEGIRSKRRTFKSGQTYGGSSFARGQIHFILTNPIYIGCVRHKNEIYPGQHRAIIADDIWQRVQSKLQSRAAKPRRRDRATNALLPPKQYSPLASRIYDETGDRLTPSHTQAKTKRFRYYVSARLMIRGTGTMAQRDPSGWRLPAAGLEKHVAASITAHLCEQKDAFLITPDSTALYQLGRAVDTLCTRLDKDPGDTMRELIARIDISPGALNIALNRDVLAGALSVEPAHLDQNTLLVSTKFQIRKRGVETRIVSGKFFREADATLVRAIATAHGWLAETRKGTSLAAIGRRHGWTDSPVRQRIKLAFLSPRITEAILAGKQPPQLTLQKLLQGPIPLDWQTQWSELGFEEAARMQDLP